MFRFGSKTGTVPQFVLASVGLTVAVALLAYFGFPFYFDTALALFPGVPETDAIWTWVDWGYLALVLAAGMPMAAWGGWWLSQRVVVPLLEVARAVREIAAGDLTARADPHLLGFGEAARLVEDFNAMAARLERSETELRYSNSAVAHELRTPLTILKGRLQGISDGVFPMTPELVDLLLLQVDGLVRIVEDLRTLSLFNAGNLDIRLERCDLSEVAQQSTDLSSEALRSSRIGLSLDLSPAPVNADPARIRQLVLALIDNACRYAPGTPLAISTGTSSEECFLQCRDQGPGLSAHDIGKVFDPFWRADASRGRAEGGSGLGLSIVKAIAAAHDGRVEASNPTGGGACFTLYMPRRQRGSDVAPPNRTI